MSRLGSALGTEIHLVPDFPDDIPRSYRRLKDDGAYVAEYVRFLYCREIKQKRDSLYKIAKDRRDRLRATGNNISISTGYVINGIRAAKRWLSAFEHTPEVI